MGSAASLPQGGAGGGALAEELDRLVLADKDIEDEVDREDGPVEELILAGTAFGELLASFL